MEESNPSIIFSLKFGLTNEPYPKSKVGHFQGWVGSQKFPFWHVHPIRGLHTCARAEPSYSSVPDGNMFVWTTNPIQIAMIRQKASHTKEKLLRRPHNPRRLQTTMATASASFSMLGWVGRKKATSRHKMYTVMAQQQQQQQQAEVQQQQQQQQQNPLPQQQQQANAQRQPPVSEPLQPMAKSKNMFREYGGQWLSSVTRHVRIYAAYIDPVTNAFDQTQMDKLTLILDPTNEFVWTPETCNKVYAYFQELVDHYEGAPLTEYTLRLIGSDIEHYIRKMLYDGEIKYNMNAQTLNFSMGKPRVIFKNNQTENVP